MLKEPDMFRPFRASQSSSTKDLHDSWDLQIFILHATSVGLKKTRCDSLHWKEEASY